MTDLDACLGSSNPDLDCESARALLRRAWGIAATSIELDSTQDQNFRVICDDGRSFVLKVANACWSRAELELQNAAMRHVASKRPGFEIQRAVPALDGDDIVAHGTLLVRLLPWIDGQPMSDRPWLGQRAWRSLGAMAAETCRTLEDFEHPTLDRELQWDPRFALAATEHLLGQLAPIWRSLTAGALDPLAALIARDPRLPVQPIHCDVTDFNVVTATDAAGEIELNGLIDFGDVVRTWRVTEVAHAAMAAICQNPDGGLASALAVLSGFHAASPLQDSEVEAFWPLLLARAAVCALSSAQRGVASADADDPAGRHSDRHALEYVLGIPEAFARAACREACELDPCPAGPQLRAAVERAKPAPVVMLDGHARIVDLSPSSPAYDPGDWRSPRGVEAALPNDGVAIGRWGEMRIDQAGDPSAAPAPTLHLGADVFAAPGTQLRSPLPGRVERVGASELTVACAAGDEIAWVRLAGASACVAAGTEVERGQTIAHVLEPPSPSSAYVHVQLGTAPDLPGLGDAAHRAAWTAVCPDPSALIGIDAAAAPPAAPATELERRGRSVASVQKLYYDRPPVIVRGWRHLLYDADARPYLDMVNNVAAIGHGHPRVADAAARQLRLLNTNSRFLYDSLSEYAERLSATLPDALDRVMLVNSGSEAVELALAIARTCTGRDDAIAIEGAYHGWTSGAFELCTNPVDRPDWRESLSERVQVVPQPNPYRGIFGDDAARYADAVAEACCSSSRRGGVAAFISEPLLGNQGGVVPPAGYLAAAYDAVRRDGGLCIADEVQVSFGRTGDGFWAFEHEHVTPDIVCVAKAAGAGYPLGAVVCSRELSDRFARDAGFFSTPAGSPLSCAVGLAVLDAVRDERLQGNAETVGRTLRADLESVAAGHQLVGAVHGRGLYLGIELVRDRYTKEPASGEALALCERLRELGVIDQPTGDAYNVLKVKPPLCIDAAAASAFVEALDRALTDIER